MNLNSTSRAVSNRISLIVPGPAGDIEVLVEEPVVSQPANTQGAVIVPKHVGVICHPHPLFGGTMTNKVVHVLARTYNQLSAPAVRFNFRGVGKSTGIHDEGRGEVDDALAVVQWAEKRWPGVPIWLAGFSFGGAIALQVAKRFPVHRLLTVAPGLRWLQQVDNSVPECPWLIVQGDQDELVNVLEVQQWASSLVRPPGIQILIGAEHFFHGRLNDLANIVKDWLSAD